MRARLGTASYFCEVYPPGTPSAVERVVKVQFAAEVSNALKTTHNPLVLFSSSWTLSSPELSNTNVYEP